MTGSTFAACWFALATLRSRAALRASASLGPQSFTPRALAAARAALVLIAIMARSFSASAANRCRMNGSTSGPSSATRNGTRWTIRPEMKCTSECGRCTFSVAQMWTNLAEPAEMARRAPLRVADDETIGEPEVARLGALPRVPSLTFALLARQLHQIPRFVDEEKVAGIVKILSLEVYLEKFVWS